MWVPTMDGRRRTTPIILKTLDVDEFDHSASWPSKVRNVSRLGRQILWRDLTLRKPPSTLQVGPKSAQTMCSAHSLERPLYPLQFHWRRVSETRFASSPRSSGRCRSGSAFDARPRSSPSPDHGYPVRCTLDALRRSGHASRHREVAAECILKHESRL
jgi:hypothetical protein